MNFLIDFVIGAVITISGEQVVAQKSPVPAISASAPSRPASVPAGREFIPSTEQMKDKV